MEDNDFKWNYCPECGGSVRSNWTVVCAGQLKKCTECYKEWHVIWENSNDFNEDLKED